MLAFPSFDRDDDDYQDHRGQDHEDHHHQGAHRLLFAASRCVIHTRLLRNLLVGYASARLRLCGSRLLFLYVRFSYVHICVRRHVGSSL